jgi:Uma2 family endonuclease
MSETTGSSAAKSGGKFTIADYASWPDDERWELIGGVAYGMSPSPTVPHQLVSGDLYATVRDFLDGKPCLPFIAPIDVYLPEAVSDTTDTVVQPDILVVCDASKIQHDGIHGAPDFVVEVLSESTAYKDLNDKRAAYERSGVREYWLVNPGSGSVLQYQLRDERLELAGEVRQGSPARSCVLDGFTWVLRAELLKTYET